MADASLIGVGLVGTALAERFLAAGLSVVGYDVRSEALNAVSGLIAAESPKSAAEASTWIVLSLPDSDDVVKVIHEIEIVCRGKTIIDTTTGDPDRTAALGSRLHQAGIRYVDATISGSSREVREGTAIVTAGGAEAVVQECSQLFDLFAKRWFHVGPWGSGSRIKLVVNLVLGLNRAVLAEGLSFAKACGFELAATLEVLKAGPAFSRVMDTKGQKMLTGDFMPEARLRQHWKDVRLIQSLAENLGISLPLSNVHQSLLARLDAQGLGELDNSVILRAYEGE